MSVVFRQRITKSMTLPCSPVAKSCHPLPFSVTDSEGWVSSRHGARQRQPFLVFFTGCPRQSRQVYFSFISCIFIFIFFKMRLQKLQSYKQPSNPDKQRVFACNFCVTFVTFETILNFVTAIVTSNSLIISVCNFVTVVTDFFISSEIIFVEFSFGYSDYLANSWR